MTVETGFFTATARFHRIAFLQSSSLVVSDFLLLSVLFLYQQ